MLVKPKDNIFKKALIAPLKNREVNKLQIVSGYASHSMADYHIEKLLEINKPFKIDLIIGMTNKDGLNKSTHNLFKQLSKNSSSGSEFNCRYVVDDNPHVHAKSYCWFNDDQPLIAFSGSANYTNSGFFAKSQVETLTITDPLSCSMLYDSIFDSSVSCLENMSKYKILTEVNERDVKSADEIRRFENSLGQRLNLSLLDKKTGKPHKPGGGVNWGIEVPGKRKRGSPDEAYIAVPADIGRTDFFPEKKIRFSVETDDGYEFVCTRAQGKIGKAIETPPQSNRNFGNESSSGNAILGLYIRQRLGIPFGTEIEYHHLSDYGRTDITFTKLESETFRLDFSV